MSLHVGLPQLTGDQRDSARVADVARRAEALGFVGLWTIDSAVGGATAHASILDGLHTLTYAAAVTQRATLGIAVIVLPRRHPLLLARELATLDRLSDGRLIVGVGIGGDDTAAGELGFPTGRRVRRFTEGVEILRAAWNNGPAIHEGELYRFDGLEVEPKPFHPGGPPIWFGAGNHRALRRAARLADGWIGSGSSSAAAFAEQSRTLDEELRAAGRDPGTFPKAKRVYLAVEDDAHEARRRLTDTLDAMYARPGMGESCGIWGPPESVAEQLAELRAAGARQLVLHPVYEPLRQLEALAEVARILDPA